MTETQTICPNCGATAPASAAVCPNCGKALPARAAASGRGCLVLAGLAILILAIAAVGMAAWLARNGGFSAAPPAATAVAVVEQTATEAPLVIVTATPAVVTATPVVTEEAAQEATVVEATVVEATMEPTPEPTAAEPTQPVETPGPTPFPPGDASFDGQGVAFAYDSALAASVEQQPLDAVTGPDVAPWDVAPARRQITLNGYPVLASAYSPQITIYPVEEYYAADPAIIDRLAQLQELLVTRPAAPLPQTLPFFPSVNATQVLATNAQFVRFQNGWGIRYLTQYQQGIYPINNEALFYTFQGLTDDNKWLITAILPVNNPALPDPQVVIAQPEFLDVYPQYIETTRLLLESLPPESFTPNLNRLDALFQSMTVQ